MARLPRLLARDARGAVQVEFLVAMLPVFTFCLAILQLALLYVSDLVVNHAAWAGARAASVVLDDDPKRYDGLACGVLSPAQRGAGPDLAGKLSAQLAGLAGGGGVSPGGGAAPTHPATRGGARLAVIRRAVSRPLTALAPDAAALAGLFVDGGVSSVDTTLGHGNLSRLGVGLGFYNDWVAAVTFPTEPGGEAFHREALPDAPGEVTVRVTYLQRCGVPLASALMCRSALDFALDAVLPGDKARKAEDAAARAELEQVPSRAGLSALLAAGGRYLALRAEVTLPRQRAPYACLPAP